jgi:hypothetical protein
MVPSAVTLLQSGVLGVSLTQLLVALVVAGLVVLVGRFFLKVAWRIVTLAILVVGVLLLLSSLGVGF